MGRDEPLRALRRTPPVFAALGVNAAGFRSYDRNQWTTVVGPDLAIAVMGHELTAEVTFSIPDTGGRTVQGL